MSINKIIVLSMIVIISAYSMSKKPVDWLTSYHVNEDGSINNWCFAVVPPLFKKPFKEAVVQEYDDENDFWLLIGDERYAPYKDHLWMQAQTLINMPYHVIDEMLPNLINDTKSERRTRLILQELLLLPALDLSGFNGYLDHMEANLRSQPTNEQLTTLKKHSIRTWRAKIAEFICESDQPSFTFDKRFSALFFFIMVKKITSQGLLELECIEDKLEETRALNATITAQDNLSDYLLSRYAFKKHANQHYLNEPIKTHLIDHNKSGAKNRKKKRR
ncbi:hypothetical protein Noda2021_09390 [Candidatus Dependentiae bacterium Noda2021]|nr:hypothetical protein Noda2021_09390 [Candidatus Dependentiae bacterium Noda2021]